MLYIQFGKQNTNWLIVVILYFDPEAKLSQLASSLPCFGNTILLPVLSKMIIDHSSSWQAHLEHVSDYILLGEGVWWKKIGNESIEFFDGESHPNFKSEGPSLHHFHSTNFEKEVNYLKECWEKCMENIHQIPVTQLRIPDCNGNMVLTRNIINKEEADDGMNSGGDEGDIVMVEKVVVSCGDRVVSVGNDGDKATDGIGSLFCEDKVDGDSVAYSGKGNWQDNGDENGISEC